MVRIYTILLVLRNFLKNLYTRTVIYNNFYIALYKIYARFIQNLHQFYQGYSFKEDMWFLSTFKWNFTLQSATVNNDYVVVIIGYLSY